LRPLFDAATDKLRGEGVAMRQVMEADEIKADLTITPSASLQAALPKGRKFAPMRVRVAPSEVAVAAEGRRAVREGVGTNWRSGALEESSPALAAAREISPRAKEPWGGMAQTIFFSPQLTSARARREVDASATQDTRGGVQMKFAPRTVTAAPLSDGTTEGCSPKTVGGVGGGGAGRCGRRTWRRSVSAEKALGAFATAMEKLPTRVGGRVQTATESFRIRARTCAAPMWQIAPSAGDAKLEPTTVTAAPPSATGGCK
jgi:hypothetical protein